MDFRGLGAVVLHAGGAALAVAHLRIVEPDDTFGTPAIEIGLEMTAPHLEPTDLPPGPDAEASVASPALAEQKAEVKETELPKDVPTETDDPDRVVAPNSPIKPKEDDIKNRQGADFRLDGVRSPPRQPRRPVPKPFRRGRVRWRPRRAPAQARSACAPHWQKELIAHLDRHKRYPAERSQKSAEIVVSFALDRMGHVLSASIVKGSGDKAFDEAALAMVRRSDPVPQPPPAVADEGLNFTLPVIFKVKGRG